MRSEEFEGNEIVKLDGFTAVVGRGIPVVKGTEAEGLSGELDYYFAFIQIKWPPDHEFEVVGHHTPRGRRDQSRVRPSPMPKPLWRRVLTLGGLIGRRSWL